MKIGRHTDQNATVRKPEIRYINVKIVFALLVFSIVLMSLITDNFLSVKNLTNMTRNFMETALLALPMTFIILTNAIDLSVGGTVAMCAIILAKINLATGNLTLAVTLTLLVGALGGALNGYLVGYKRIPSFIVTLATMYLFGGIAQGLSEAETLTGLPESFRMLGNGFFLHMPMQFWIFVFFAILFSFVLRRMRYGRNLRVIGFNPESAEYAGIHVAQTHLINYTVSGLMAALAALIFVSRISAAKSNAGIGYETDAIMAVVLGGTSISGGYGSIEGTIVGIMLVGVIRNGLTLARVSSETTTILLGMLLLLTIIFSENAKAWIKKFKKEKN